MAWRCVFFGSGGFENLVYLANGKLEPDASGLGDLGPTISPNPMLLESGSLPSIFPYVLLRIENDPNHTFKPYIRLYNFNKRAKEVVGLPDVYSVLTRGNSGVA